MKHRGAPRNRRFGKPFAHPAFLAAWGLLAACGTPHSEPTSDRAAAKAVQAPPTPRGRPSFSTAGLDTALPCAPTTASPPIPSAVVPIRLISGSGVSAHDTQVVGETIRLVWERLGLRLRIAGPDHLPASAPQRLFDPTGTTEEAQLAPMRSVLAALPKGASTTVVVMPRFVDQPSKLEAFRGLTVPAEGSANQPLSVGGAAFVESNPHPHPVAFINMAAGPRAPGDLSLSPAHELGHALGLEHQNSDQALMSDGMLSLRCLPGLSDAEWTQVAAAVAASEAASALP